MKKLNNETNNQLKVSATIDDFPFLEKLVEKLSYRRSDNGYAPVSVTTDLKTIDTSSIEAYVSGSCVITTKEEIVNMPFTSCFFFTCTRGYEGVDKLAWINSLS